MRCKRGFLQCLLVVAAAVGVIVWVYDTVHSRIIFGIRDDFSRAVKYDTPVAGIPGIRAEQCGACHPDIYEEWKTSYHAQAYVDPLFQAYWRKDKNIWICLNCHSPLEPQQPYIIQGLEGGKAHKPIQIANPNYDPEFQKEGITCASCHVRDGVIEGPYKDSVAPHPTRFNERFLTTEICFTCHQVPSGPFQFYNGGPCSTFPEFEEGPYAKAGMTCQDCHMPKVDRAVAVGGPIRHARRHLWRGGHDPEMVRRAVGVSIFPEKMTFLPGQPAEILLKMTNAGAGHKIPTGDPDRFFTIEFEMIDKNDRRVDSASHSMGRWILWWPLIVELYENRLVPQASREYAYAFRVPRDPAGMRLVARIRYHILTDKQYKNLQDNYGLEEEVDYRFTVFEQEWRLDSGESIVHVAAATPALSACEADGKPKMS